MAWVELASAFVVATALLLLPGLPLGAAAGFRGGWLIGASIPLSLTVVGLTAVTAPHLGMDWSLLPVVVATISATLVVAGLRRAMGRRWSLGLPSYGRRTEWVGLSAVMLAGVILCVRLAHALGDPTSISQTFDAVFHLNAVQWILDTRDASPSNVSSMTTGADGFYPASFHAFVALASQLTGVSVAVAVNATWLAHAAVAWPIAIVLLTRTLAGSSRPVLLSAGILAAGLPAFPLLLVNFGVLYPLLSSYVALPAVLALSVRALGLGAEPTDRPGTPNVPLLLAVGVALAGLALMHPTALVAWMVIVSPWVLISVVLLVRRTPRRSVRLGWAGVAVLWLVVVWVGSQALRPSATWPPTRSVVRALKDLAFGTVDVSTDHYGAPVVAMIVIWVGGLALLRRRAFRIDQRLALLSGPAVVGLLYVMVTAIDHPWVRDHLTAAWYSNAPRISALVPLAVIPVGALGVQALWRLVRRWRTPHRDTAWAAAGVAALVAGVQGSAAMSAFYDNIQFAYTLDRTSELLTTDEATLLDRLDAHVPDDAVIIGNPWTGTSLAYALTGHPVLYPHIFTSDSPDLELVNEGLRDAVAGGEVCAALNRLGVEYVLDFGTREVHGQRHPMMGVEWLGLSDAVELVDEQGRARLYHVTACD